MDKVSEPLFFLTSCFNERPVQSSAVSVCSSPLSDTSERQVNGNQFSKGQSVVELNNIELKNCEEFDMKNSKVENRTKLEVGSITQGEDETSNMTSCYKFVRWFNATWTNNGRRKNNDAEIEVQCHSPTDDGIGDGARPDQPASAMVIVPLLVKNLR